MKNRIAVCFMQKLETFSYIFLALSVIPLAYFTFFAAGERSIFATGPLQFSVISFVGLILFSSGISLSSWLWKGSKK